MSRPFRSRALAAVLALVAAGCQDYNFNPVGHCLIQPGSQSTPLTNISSADVLFVIDDSGSMEKEQDRLGDAFSDFVENLTATNAGLAATGNVPIDFHVAVTTSSVFYNRQPLSAQTCSASCGVTGLACCTGTTPVYGPRACRTLGAGASECPVQVGAPVGNAVATSCRNDCDGLKGSLYCCASNGSFPAPALSSFGGEVVRCQLEGQPCGKLQTHYAFGSACVPGVASDEHPYPDGAFVGSTSVAAVRANPRVLHFDRRLYLTEASAGKDQGRNAQGFTIPTLQAFFRQNVQVGTCGSPQEQGLEAARRAIVRALSSDQYDTYTYNRAAGFDPGSAATATATFTVQNGVPKLVTKASWPNPDSKLVVVYVGDEDDCSSPKDPAAGVLISNGDVSGDDGCTADGTLGPTKRYAVSRFVDALTGLGRPVGAAFVVSANSPSTGDATDCRNDACVANYCVDPDPFCTDSNVCGGQAPGSRFVEAAQQLKARGTDVVVGSVCGDFKPLLREVADIVKPPKTLALPSTPADGRIAILRIADTSTGVTRKICGRPLAPRQPDNYTLQEAEDTPGADWWFTGSGKAEPPFDPTGNASVAVPSRFIYINNPKGDCIANPGESYSMDYIGVLPEGGCTEVDADWENPGLKTGYLGSSECHDALGGRQSDWECYVPPGLTRGTCTCRSGG